MADRKKLRLVGEVLILPGALFLALTYTHTLPGFPTTGILPLVYELGFGGMALVGVVLVGLSAFDSLQEKRSLRRQGQTPTGFSDKDMGAQVPFGAERKWLILRGYVRVQVTRIKDIPDDKGSFQRRRVITANYLISRKAKIFLAKLGIPNMPLGGFYLDPAAMNSEGRIVYDENYCEPYQSDGQKPKWSPTVALLMANAFVGSAIEVATIISGFQFNRGVVYVLAIAAILGFFTVWTVAPMLGLFPAIKIAWLPAPPKVR